METRTKDRRSRTRSGPAAAEAYVCWLGDVGMNDVARVGGKNASLGELTRALTPRGIRVPDGFATTAAAYRAFIEQNGVESALAAHLEAFHAGRVTLAEAGEAIRELILGGEFPPRLAEEIRVAYRELGRRYGRDDVDVAVRSSATAEDLPDASFAGQLDTFLNVTGQDDLLDACRRCFASLFTDRAIAYREEKGFDHLEVAVSVGVQKMVRSDLGASGVLFTLDTDSGFPDVVLITATWGLGELVVQGAVSPDQYTVFKPFLDGKASDPVTQKQRGPKRSKMVYGEGADATSVVETSAAERDAWVLSQEEILGLARWAVRIEEHYGRPMDVEWAKDGERGELYIVQARPETVESHRDAATLKSYHLEEEGERLVTGLAIGRRIATGRVQVLASAEDIESFRGGGVLVTTRTDPDWVPIMRRAAAIVTDLGGRTSHAAIVSRELGIPTIVGAVDATRRLEEGTEVTVSCAEGAEGHVYRGALAFREERVDLGALPETRTRILMNVGSPEAAMAWWRLPSQGVGLARMEYLISNVIQAHPLALVRLAEVEDADARKRIQALLRGWDSAEAYFVENLARGIATIAAAAYPDPVIVRMSDFKSNEYADLIGGRQFEPEEANPMLGWRGASRYYSPEYREGFALECRAVRYARREMGFDNVIVMIPFCRTPEEADRVLEAMAGNGLVRGEDGLKVYVMAEIPSNVIEAEAFAERFDGFSIGSNDLTQLTLGVSRDSEMLAHLFDESQESVKRMIRMLIERAHAAGKPVGICGEGPSNDLDFAAFLVEAGIDSISLSPDTIVQGIRTVAEAEERIRAASRAASPGSDPA